MKHTCPRCKSHHVHRSKALDPDERLHFLKAPYRCNHCGSRFWAVPKKTWVRMGVTSGAVAIIAGWWTWQAYDIRKVVDDAATPEAPAVAAGSQDYASAMRYLTGEGVRKDPARAIEYLERSVKDGHGAAQYQLGLMLRDGIGTRADPVRAFTWLRMAAESGNARAQLEVAAMYLEGRGTDANAIQGYAWASLAAAQRVRGADDLRDRALLSLTADDASYARAEARRLAESILHGNVAAQF